MQIKKLYLGLGLAVLLVAISAFVAGRMLNGSSGTVGLGGPNAGRVSISLNDITPAPELPARKADVTGLFVERKDSTLVVQVNSFGSSIGGISGDTPMDEASGTRVEIVVTSQTKIFKDITQIPSPVNGEIHNVQQAAGPGILDDLNSQTFISVWGRRSGDRVVAEVLFYSNPQSIKKP
jgi:hypothetical protein